MFSETIKLLFKKNKKYKCATCGKIHDELPDVGSLAPFHWNDVFDNKNDCILSDDLCVIENRDYFIRGVIQIPIKNTDDFFGWGVWISQKKENFEIYKENFDSDQIGPFFGWLCTKIDYYKEDTINLKTKAHFRGKGLRPIIEVGPSDHELYLNQKDGLDIEEIYKIIHFYTKNW